MQSRGKLRARLRRASHFPQLARFFHEMRRRRAYRFTPHSSSASRFTAGGAGIDFTTERRLPEHIPCFAEIVQGLGRSPPQSDFKDR
jgi:hypothetical protein